MCGGSDVTAQLTPGLLESEPIELPPAE
jgi:hypothetical protein